MVFSFSAVAAKARLCAAFAALFVGVMYGLLNRNSALSQFIQSDSLLPAQMVWDFAHHPYAWRNFQWPRVPSVVPDMAVFAVSQMAGVGWRWTMAAFAVGQAWLLALAGGWVVSLLSGEAWAGAAALYGWAMLALFVPSMIGFAHPELDPIPWMVPLHVLVPATHGGPFVLSVFAACCGVAALAGAWVPLAVMLVLCVAGAFSDTLFFTEFWVPFAIAGAVMCWAGHVPVRRAVGVVAASLAAGGAGLLLQAGLSRESFPVFKLAFLPIRLGFFASGLPHVPVAVYFFVQCAVAIGVGIALFCGTRQAQARANSRLLYFWSFGISAALISVVTLLAFYYMANWYRYALPLPWWPLALLLGTVAARLRMVVRVLVVPGVALLLVPLLLPRPLVLRWRAPLLACLVAQPEAAGLRAGLAPYWVARPAAAASDWRLQVDQITPTGAMYLWGNDREAYRHAIDDARVPPDYRFLLLDYSVDDGALRARYGTPQRVATCDDGEVWFYDRRLTPGPGR